MIATSAQKLATKSYAWSAGSTYTIRVVANGTTIQVYVDGVLELTATGATFNQTETKHGLMRANGDSATHFDNWVVTAAWQGRGHHERSR